MSANMAAQYLLFPFFSGRKCPSIKQLWHLCLLT